MNFENLKRYGFSPRFEQEATLHEGLFPARVLEQHRELYKLVSEDGELVASVSGKLAHNAATNADFPAVGDWVMTDRTDKGGGNAVIHAVLRRKSAFERKAAGTSNATQVVAANIDTVFICMSLNANFNVRRLERYLSIVWDSMAAPVIVLTKADLCGDIDARMKELSAAAVGTDVVTCSVMEEDGYRGVLPYVKAGKTVAFIGSSGVGKSTLINRLMGEDVLITSELGTDDTGRHTTTHRQLLLLPGGGIVIDTPGMRELQLEYGELTRTFGDIEELAAFCRYRDCSHLAEPGCAVKRAIEEGTLDRARLHSYQKLQKEIGYAEQNARQREQEKINRIFGSKGQMKQTMREIRNKNKFQ
ncbi:MAG TPA: ribosome small subunit-dependent GTPase A [Feifaniaceae bacterium]|nr:ribosome small subunit-dependent GTPase A [Feifaniaceae bacterium]